jgi:DNA (cytosine-5)-methyltransferase 1
MRYYGEGGQWSDCRAPSPTDTTKARMGVVTVAGCDWQIIDIGMRMLSPRERFDAQGFPPGYVIDPGITLAGRRITGEIQGRLVGNSVCPPVAEALVAANCADMVVAAGEAAA